MTEDFYLRRANGVREPDPTLGKRPRRPLPQPSEQAVVESVPGPVEPEPQPEPEHHSRPKRQRVILNDPKRASSSLRARVELEEQTSWGKLLVKDLVKVQLRTAVLLSLLVVVVFCSLPVLFYLLPGFARLTLAGIPVPWLILGVLPFPFLFGVGLWYNRLAERHERDFVDMIEN